MLNFNSNLSFNFGVHFKAALVLGVSDAMRCDELKKLNVEHIQIEGNILIVHVPETKNVLPRKFTVEPEWTQVVKQYWKLRPRTSKDAQFFYNFQKGKCTKQVIGINKFYNIPSQIARFLNLPNVKEFTGILSCMSILMKLGLCFQIILLRLCSTGHSFRRMSASLLANTPNISILDMKRHSGWKSTKAAEGCIDDSLLYKQDKAKRITSAVIGDKNNVSIPPQNPSTICEELPNLSTSKHNFIKNTSNSDLSFSNLRDDDDVLPTNLPLSQINADSDSQYPPLNIQVSQKTSITQQSSYSSINVGHSPKKSEQDKSSVARFGNKTFHFTNCPGATFHFNNYY